MLEATAIYASDNLRPAPLMCSCGQLTCALVRTTQLIQLSRLIQGRVEDILNFYDPLNSLLHVHKQMQFADQDSEGGG